MRSVSFLLKNVNRDKKVGPHGVRVEKMLYLCALNGKESTHIDAGSACYDRLQAN
jgi:hypothetical protein